MGTWGGHPSSGPSYIYTHRQGIAANGTLKGYSTIPLDKMPLRIPVEVVSSTSCLTATAFRLQVSHVLLFSLCFICRLCAKAFSARTHVVFRRVQRVAQGHFEMWTRRAGARCFPPPMINDLPPELQLPIIRTCHRHQHIITLCSDSLLSLFITGSNKQII